MLKLFEKNTILQAVIILVVTALLWGQAFADPQPIAPSGHYAPLYDLLCSLNPSPLVATILAMMLVVLGGFFFNYILVRANLASQNSLLPTLLFIVAMSATSPSLSPSLLAALLVIVIVNLMLLHSTLLTVAPDKIFGTAAIIGIASMLYMPSLTLIASYLLVVVNYRLYGWRDWMMFLLGLLAPYLLLWAILFLNDSLLDSFTAMADEFSTVTFTVAHLSSLQTAAHIVLLAVFVVSLLLVWSRMGERTVVWQKNSTTIMLLTITPLAIMPYSHLFPVNYHFLAIPFAYCLYQRFALSRQRRGGATRASWRQALYDILFILTLVAALVC